MNIYNCAVILALTSSVAVTSSGVAAAAAADSSWEQRDIRNNRERLESEKDKAPKYGGGKAERKRVR